jgi:GDP-4-dehydro-6-deoxy-D-mannose reductase
VRVLVTGAGGFAAQHLLRALLHHGCTITAGTQDGVPPAPDTLTALEIEQVEWIAIDVTQAASVRAAVERSRPERVFHLAAQSSVGRSHTDPAGTWEVNAVGTVRLLDEVARGTPQARVLLVGSAEAYGVVAEAEQPIPESRPLAPTSPYGASKAAAEMAALAAVASGLHVVTARSFNHTGPGQDGRFALPSFAAQLARIARGEAEPVLRVGNLEARRDFLDVRDVVRAYRLLLERGAVGAAYNVCSGEAHSLRELVESLIALSGLDVRIEVEAARVRPVDIPLLQGDPARLAALGWRPEIALRQTLADLLTAAGVPLARDA